MQLFTKNLGVLIAALAKPSFQLLNPPPIETTLALVEGMKLGLELLVCDPPSGSGGAFNEEDKISGCGWSSF